MIVDDLVKVIDDVSVEEELNDYWYDVGIVQVENMLQKFSMEEWDLLRKLVKDKPVEWKKKLIYGFDGEDNEQEFKIIMDIIDTDDSELFEVCIDSLRYLMNERTGKLIWKKPELLEKVQSIALKNDTIVQRIYIDFLERLEKLRI